MTTIKPPAEELTEEQQLELRCSFCDSPRKTVGKMIQSNQLCGATICDHCWTRMEQSMRNPMDQPQPSLECSCPGQFYECGPTGQVACRSCGLPPSGETGRALQSLASSVRGIMS